MAGKGRWSPDVVAALQSVLARRPGPGFDVVSNLPYGISTSFLTSLAHEPGPPRRATVMLQLEVARALGASAGDDDYSALSVFVRTYFDVRREFEVGRHAFFPEPDVGSAVVGLVPRSAPGPEPGAFGRFVQALFQARRKAIGTSLRGIAGSGVAELLAAAGFDPRARVDGLEPERIAVLFGEFSAWRPAS
jgi:16S rRNA (adenine1518-N6/adenine1519-N6)-dimethyltransferase